MKGGEKMKKVLIILAAIMITLSFVACDKNDEYDDYEPSGINWYNKIQRESVYDSYLLEIITDFNDAIKDNELNAFITLVRGLKGDLFDFSKDEFNKYFDIHVYYADEPRYSRVCKDLGIKIKDFDLLD